MCDSCRRGDFITCEKLQIPGISYDGGYAESVIAPIESLAHIPNELTPEEAAPIMCAVSPPSTRCATAEPGPATWSRSRASADSDTWESSSRANLVSRRSRSARGADKKPLALKLGARTYIDSASQDVAKELAAWAARA